MRSKFTFSVKLLLLVVILTSCGSKFSLQKRRYNKGFHLSVTKELKPVKQGSDVNGGVANNENTASIVKEESAAVVANIPETQTDKTDEKALARQPKVSAKKNTSKIEFNPAVQTDEFEKGENNTRGKSAVSSFHKKRGFGLFDILDNIYAGYVAVCIVLAIIYLGYYLFTVVPATQAIPIVAGIVIVLVLLYLIGNAVK